MTLKLTARDKKLLVFLAIFVMVVGIGAGVIYPLVTWTQSLEQELTAQQELQIQNEQKVARVATMEKGKEQMMEEIEKAAKDYYPIMNSEKIDKMLTEYVLSRGITVTNLDIAMPQSGSYTQLVDYSQMLANRSGGQSGTAAETPTYNGVYTAKVQISISGGRDTLQSILDYWSKQEPKMRMVEFVWQNRSREEATDAYLLSMSLELYMVQDTEEFLQQNAAAAAAAQAAAQAAQAG